MKSIRHVGDDVYVSTDPWNGDKTIRIGAGGTAEVSDEKAAQLLADFPDRFRDATPVEQPERLEQPVEDSPPVKTPPRRRTSRQKR